MTDEPAVSGPGRQEAIRADGSTVPLSSDELRRAAERTLSKDAYAFLIGGAGDEETIDGNRDAFRRREIVPRVLRDVERRDLSVSLPGFEAPVPVLLAPIGMQSYFHPDAELATARAAASVDVPLVLSSVASSTIEAVADAHGDASRWFQLYWSDDADLTKSLVERAAAADYDGIVLTVDSPLTGWRTREIDRRLTPWESGHGRVNYWSDPVFRDRLERPPEEDPAAALDELRSVFANRDHTWDAFERLRADVDGPLLVKGILHGDDARRAVDLGADGVVVSNHGGRQLDGVVGSLDALPAVVEALDGSVPVLLDSGVRRGTDVFKALALGADAVLLGRPYVYGLAIEGQAGVKSVLRNVIAQFDLAMGLCGCGSVTDVDGSHVRRRP
jgi:isopentenyl-diphosphate delta-isomerase